MLVPKGSPVEPENNNGSAIALQLLLFVDERSSAREQTQRIGNYLQNLQGAYPFELETVEVGERPDLVEYFRLVATPSLVKIYPEPRQTLMGANLVAQLEACWSRWLQEVEDNSAHSSESQRSLLGNDLGSSLERIRLSEEIFQLKKENEALQAQLQFKDQALALLAHDLRSPLTAASIAVETLEAIQEREITQSMVELTKNLFKQARAQLRTMNRMIADILQMARNNSAELRLECRPLPLKPLCEEILAGFGDRFNAKSLQLTTDLPQDLPAVYADTELVRQTIVNLLDNAIKYTPAGGTIGLAALHRTSGKVQVSVEDTGPGIPEEKRDRIFEGHFRLERDEAKDGYGLGLALCRKVVRAHYGQIWVDSTSGEGSCFNFTLPVYR
ncbi:MAG: histidine kinase [Cyanobacteriota bacterium]|nr:histidine kinase [Cyanobacteriota bacterium]